MPDNFTPTPVKTRTDGDIVSRLVDDAGINRAVINTEGELFVSNDVRQVAGAPTDVGNGAAGPGTQRVVIADDNEPIQVSLTATDDPNAVENAVFTRLSDGTNPVGTRDNPLVVVTEGAGAGGLVDSGALVAVDVAAGATVDLTAPAVALDRTGRLIEITASASVRTKVELFTNGDRSRVFFVDANESLVYTPRDGDQITAAGGEAYLLRVTNMDNQFAADVYGSVAFEAI